MDILNAILYQFKSIDLAWWIAIGVITSLLFIFRHNRKQLIGNFLIIYIITILASTVLSRSKISGYSYAEFVNMNLLGTWIERFTGDLAHKSEILLNFCMLLPVGVLFPWATRKGFFSTVLVGFALIIIIELAQLITMRGWFELTDIVDNTIGVMIGYGLFQVGETAWRRIKC